MSQAPSMPFFVDAYLADTGHLSTEEHGAYLLLLMAMWRRNGAVPDDDRDNARVTRMSTAKWGKIKNRLLPFLTLVDGEITQKRLQKEWNYVKEMREKNAQNGLRGGRPRTKENNDIDKAGGSVSVMPDETQTKANPVPYPVPYPKEEEQEARSTGVDTPIPSPSNVPRETPKVDLFDIGNIPPALDRRGEKPTAEIVPLVTQPEREIEVAIEAYNLTAQYAKWPTCQVVTDKRRKAVKARLADAGGLDGWKEAMRKAALSSFLLGKTGRGGDHANWRPDIDFFLTQSKFTKLMEGGYDDPDRAQGGGGQLGRLAEAAAVALAAGDPAHRTG